MKGMPLHDRDVYAMPCAGLAESFSGFEDDYKRLAEAFNLTPVSP